jgi:hypothetical protein
MNPESHTALALPAQGLTEEGAEWLQGQPPELPACALGLYELAAEFAAAFRIPVIDAVVAVVAAMSLVAGPRPTIASPVGPRLPLSLQILTVAGESPGFDRCLWLLCQGVVDACAREFGRDLFEDDASLTAKQLESEQRWRSFAEQAKQAEEASRFSGCSNPGQYQRNSVEFKKAQADEFRNYTRFVRKKYTFPFCDAPDEGILRQLIQEGGDACLGSFSPQGDALAHLLGASPRGRTEILGFMNAGFHGGLLTCPTSSRSVFPTASAVWACRPDAIRDAFAKNLPSAMTGFMLAVPSPTQPSPPAEIPQALRERWTSFIGQIVPELRLQFFRRNSAASNELACGLDEDARQAVTRTLDWGSRFTNGGGFPRDVLARAPEMVLKIAALLSLDTMPHRPVGAGAVALASEVFRWLARGIIGFEASRGQESLSREVEVLTQKLIVHGPLRMRDLVRTYDRQDYGRIRATLVAALELGKVVENEKRFCALTS